MSKIRLKTKLSNNEITVKTIISHPMDTGRKILATNRGSASQFMYESSSSQ